MAREPFLPKAGGKRLKRFLAALDIAARHPGEGQVHDLRVAIRRLLAFIALAEPMPGGRPPFPPQLPDALEALMRPLGRLRDAHVKLLRIGELAPKADPCSRQYWLAVLSDSEKWEDAVGRTLAGAEPGKLGKAFRALPLSPLPADDLEAPAMAQLQARETEVTRLSSRFLAERTARSLHDLRLGFKRYRYTAEALSSLLPGLTPDAGSRLHGFQTLLGDIHDCDVLLEEARRFREKVLGMTGEAGLLESAAGRAREDSMAALLGILQNEGGVAELFAPRRTSTQGARKR